MVFMHQHDKSNKTSSLAFAWLIWGLAAAFFFLDYLARVAPGVMHRNLQLAFGINEAGFGILTASFYLPYVIMQIPVGLTVDRMSIRYLLTFMSLITALGCVVFGSAADLPLAAFGRILIGFSAAFAFVSALRLATTWFPPAMLGLLAGLTQALGMLGAATGETPIAMMLEWVGWRHTMFIIAGFFIILALLLYTFVQDKRPTVVKQDEYEKLSIWQSLKIVLSHRQTWFNALYAGFLFVPSAVIGEAYGPAYLQYGRGFSAHEAAFATGLIFIGWGISGPLSGWLSDRIGLRKPLMIISASSGLVISSLFVFLPGLSVQTAYLLFFLFGLTNTGVAIAYAVSAEIQSKKVVGTAIAFTNMASILVGALMQPVVGWLVDVSAGKKGYNLESLSLIDFQSGLKLLPVCSLIALILAFAVKETYCKPSMRT